MIVGKFLTGASRIKQTHKKRVWMLLDNELYEDSNGEILLAPRSMYTDNYTIPMWVSFIAGSPVDWDVRGSHTHDEVCDTHQRIIVTLTEEELKKKEYLKFNDKIGMWICENIPKEFLKVEETTKLEANNILYRCMVAANIPVLNRVIIRLGVVFNIGWYIDKWLGRVFNIDLSQIYNEEYWNKNVWY